MILRKVVLHSELTAPVFAPEFMTGLKGMKNIDHYLVGNGGNSIRLLGKSGNSCLGSTLFDVDLPDFHCV